MKMLFLDTEFTGQDQEKPDLISIALVDSDGREFYAELPPSHYAVQCNEWVHFNVLPHLMGGDHILTVDEIRSQLMTWISNIDDHTVILNDCPDADFRLLRWLLPEWPKNLAVDPILFTTWALGDDMQPALHECMSSYYIHTRPAHNALNDAHALRRGVMFAIRHGWHYKIM
ncbi:hypothetical protein GTP58_13260 [Duganella sp. CY15W]|uniref:3'-5' exoribonuclease n=1 Tax=Duganella sp. CY15W TaxID=2692172 RepID=UPI001367DEA0|nr:3'-5' exoribonuclease [Duganella sp. CY15W]MYM29292.1 hypothetical protein [Duganella sp. CY15W]